MHIGFLVFAILLPASCLAGGSTTAPSNTFTSRMKSSLQSAGKKTASFFRFQSKETAPQSSQSSTGSPSNWQKVSNPIAYSKYQKATKRVEKMKEGTPEHSAALKDQQKYLARFQGPPKPESQILKSGDRQAYDSLIKEYSALQGLESSSKGLNAVQSKRFAELKEIFAKGDFSKSPQSLQRINSIKIPEKHINGLDTVQKQLQFKLNYAKFLNDEAALTYKLKTGTITGNEGTYLKTLRSFLDKKPLTMEENAMLVERSGAATMGKDLSSKINKVHYFQKQNSESTASINPEAIPTAPSKVSLWKNVLDLPTAIRHNRAVDRVSKFNQNDQSHIAEAANREIERTSAALTGFKPEKISFIQQMKDNMAKRKIFREVDNLNAKNTRNPGDQKTRDALDSFNQVQKGVEAPNAPQHWTKISEKFANFDRLGPGFSQRYNAEGMGLNGRMKMTTAVNALRNEEALLDFKLKTGTINGAEGRYLERLKSFLGSAPLTPAEQAILTERSALKFDRFATDLQMNQKTRKLDNLIKSNSNFEKTNPAEPFSSTPPSSQGSTL